MSEDGARQFASGPDPSSVTLLEGTTFCISSRSGDISPAEVQGLFVRDTRVLSCFRLTVDGHEPEALSSISPDPFATTFVARAGRVASTGDAGLLITRRRYVADGMREEIEIENLTHSHYRGTLRLEFDADFAHVFDVKDNRARTTGKAKVRVVGDSMVFDYLDRGRSRRLEVIVPDGAHVKGRQVDVALSIAELSSVEATVEFRVAIDDREMTPRHHRGPESDAFQASSRFEKWRWDVPSLRCDDDGLQLAYAKAGDDLGALRIFDPEQPDEAVVAAGAPWYMALFGRDSLITSMMTLPVDRRIALDTLHALARHQGSDIVPDRDEQPGKILHEMRFRYDGVKTSSSRSAYYGSIDATPLFVMLLGEARRWGLTPDEIEPLLPAADRAIAWISEFGDLDGDGFVEYAPMSARSFPNQGWKDSPDGINFADGTIASSPIALCEVQGYVYAALLARARLAKEFGDDAMAESLNARAASLKTAFNEVFYLPKYDAYAVGLDKDKKPIDSLASNIGHCLWTGIVDDDLALSVVESLTSPEMFSGFGIRTLSSHMGAFNPISYHNGSVWPHDNALAIAGMKNYGFVEHATRLSRSLLDAADYFGGRLPELFCGFARDRFARPVVYPSACSPQAWASSAIFSIVFSLLGLKPDAGANRLVIDASLLPLVRHLRLDNVAIGDYRLGIDVLDDEVRVAGLPNEIELIGGRRAN